MRTSALCIFYNFIFWNFLTFFNGEGLNPQPPSSGYATDIDDLWPRYFVCWFSLTLSRSSSKVKVKVNFEITGGKNVAKVVDETSSEGFLLQATCGDSRSFKGHSTCAAWVKKFYPFSFSQLMRIFNQNFTHLLHVCIYAKRRDFIQLSPTLTKLCHTKRDHPTSFHFSQRKRHEFHCLMINSGL